MDTRAALFVSQESVTVALEKDFDLPEMGERISELVDGSGPLWDIVNRHVQAALDTIEERVAVRTPVGATGNLRAAWGTVPPQIKGQGIIIGEVVNPVSYGPVVEEGRKPGTFPPVDAGLKLWVKRKLGVPDAQVTSVSYAIAKSIEANGTRAASMLRDGWDDALPTVDSELSAMLAEIVAELGDAITQ